MNWYSLPIKNFKLKKMRIFGNGKDCEVLIETKNDKCAVRFVMRDPYFIIECHGKIKSTVFNDGHDTFLGVEYIPLETIKITTLQIEYPGDENDWQNTIAELQSKGSLEIGWMIGGAKIVLDPIKP